MLSVTLKRIFVVAAALSIVGAGAVYAGEDVLSAKLAACPSDGTAVGGVNSCGKIWALKSGQAKLSSDGKLAVEVQGLVLNDETTGEFNGTPDGVTGVAAALICNGILVAQTDVAPLSGAGDATIEAKLASPSNCFGPVVVLREQYEGEIGGWLAATGF